MPATKRKMFARSNAMKGKMLAGSCIKVENNTKCLQDDSISGINNCKYEAMKEKKRAKIEISTNIYSWGGVKLKYHLNFNDIGLSLRPMSKYLLKFPFSPNFF